MDHFLLGIVIDMSLSFEGYIFQLLGPYCKISFFEKKLQCVEKEKRGGGFLGEKKILIKILLLMYSLWIWE